MKDKNNILSKIRWEYNLSDEKIRKEVERIAKEINITTLEATILYNRGIKTKEEMLEFLSLSDKDLHDPRLLKDAEKAAKLIAEHVKKQTPIVLFSDFDADGWGAAVSFMTIMLSVGANIQYWTNDRRDGFGMSKRTVEKMMKKYPDTELVISADNGIVAFEAVDILKENGIEVIITDHHGADKDNKVPDAYAVVNPNQPNCPYPFKGLCGAGVIWKLSFLILEYLGEDPNKAFDLIDIVSLSTVADVVPLLDENRVIVKMGLNKINKGDTKIWQLMKEVFKSNYDSLDKIDSETFGFLYGPSINALSRMLNSIELPINTFLDFLSGKAGENKTKQNMQRMLDINDKRKELSKDQTNAAIGNIVEENLLESPAIAIFNPEFHEGIVGIIAGRIKEQFNRPVIVFTQDYHNKDFIKGSGRTIEAFNIKEQLDWIYEQNPDIFVGYGGHAMAAGLTIKKKYLKEFQELFRKRAGDILTEEDFVRKIPIDFAFNQEEITKDVYKLLENLEPFGQHFEKPTLGLRNFKFNEVELKGQDKQHIFFYADNFKVVSWFGTKQWYSLGCPEEIYLVGTLSIDENDNMLTLNVEPFNIQKF